MLDARELPPQFALRGALVLGYTAHAYWNIGDAPEDRRIPPGLDVPWRTINQYHLGREEAYLGFEETFSGNFQFEDNKIPQPLADVPPCPWATEELSRYGAVEYNPVEANIFNFHPSF